MKAIDVVGHIGHRIHIARAREARTLFGWLGDLSGRKLLDVGGGDGYWAAQAQRRGATSVSVDLDPKRTDRGRRFTRRPLLVRGDALRLPFADGSFDAVMSISSIEHFGSGSSAIAEMGRVLRPGGSLVLSADSLAGSDRWPRLSEAHEHRYGVVHPFEHREL
ncbi:MAG TPA: class I SAM-dependent methyltransferase, partial [Actinomycetota bacterium]|nr:class I SAM-dependent methyltransferase [Actinomycetota bacterium]